MRNSIVNQKTKYDLSYGEVHLDYDELLKTARIAVRYSLAALESRIQKYHQLPPNNRLTNLDAEWMLEDAEALAVATTTLHYLQDGDKREDVIIERAERERQGSEE